MLRRLKSRIARFQWKMLALALVLTAAVILIGIDLLDGQIDIARRTKTPTATPLQFVVTIVGWLVLMPMAAICWMSLFHDAEDYRPRIRPELDDPAKRTPR